MRALLFLLALTTAVPAWAQPYQDVTQAAGLETILRASGLAVADIDLDGDLDIYVVSPEERDEADPTTWNHLFLNKGDGTFEDITAASGIEPFDGGYRRGQQGNRFGASFGDFDGDRLPDLFLARIGPDRLYRNKGDGTFEDVTIRARVFGTDDTANDVSAVWTDLDGDGDLDLYVCAWIGRNRLYINEGDGLFSEQAAALGLDDNGYTWSALPWDINGDGLLDLYVVNDFGPNRLYLQTASGPFEEATSGWGLEDEGNGMGVELADVNGDGQGDIYITNIADREPNPLFVRHPARFVDEAEAYGVANAAWAWGVEFFDADNDGDQDLYVVNGFPTDPAANRFFEGRTSLTGQVVFVDRSVGSGTDGRAEARALAVFDREGDGDLDLLVGNFRAPSVLLERTTEPGNWIGFWLEGPSGNSWGVGAEVMLQGHGTTQRRYLDGVEMLGQSLLPAHFGLGLHQDVDAVSVRWPDGTVEAWPSPAPGAYHTLQYGTGGAGSVAVEGPPSEMTWSEPFPNPATSWIHLGGSGWVEIFNALGQAVARRPLAEGRLDLTGLPSGFLAARLPDGRRVPFLRQR